MADLDKVIPAVEEAQQGYTQVLIINVVFKTLNNYIYLKIYLKKMLHDPFILHEASYFVLFCIFSLQPFSQLRNKI